MNGKTLIGMEIPSDFESLPLDRLLARRDVIHASICLGLDSLQTGRFVKKHVNGGKHSP
jgi:hypothetical protein